MWQQSLIVALLPLLFYLFHEPLLCWDPGIPADNMSGAALSTVYDGSPYCTLY